MKDHIMSKQQSLDLAAQLVNAQQGRDDGEMVTVRSGRAAMTVLAFNADKHAAALKTAHRKPRAKAELRSYPKFKPGMSTAEYVCAYSSMNKHGVLPGMALNTAPCALYENGALDFEVVEEQIEDAVEVQAVADAPEVAPVAEVAPASPAFVALMSNAREAKRLARQAIAQASASSAQSVPDDSDGNPYPYLQPISDTHSGGVAAAKNIRLVLKNQFPGVKFKVTSDYSSVNVRWIDGPTDAVVCEALAPFDIGHSDSQSDYFYTERTRFSEKFGGVQYLFTHRELSDSKIVASINAVFGEDGPTLAEWKAGTPWAQVARKGSYRDAQMWDQYGWLSMVRRHADEKID